MKKLGRMKGDPHSVKADQFMFHGYSGSGDRNFLATNTGGQISISAGLGATLDYLGAMAFSIWLSAQVRGVR